MDLGESTSVVGLGRIEELVRGLAVLVERVERLEECAAERENKTGVWIWVELQ
jgi:hypothetical protein